jgi:PAS domain S-box-containing protein
MIEDSEDDYLLIQRHLKKGGLKLKTKRVSDSDELKQRLESEQWDVILCDHSMPNFSAKDALDILYDKELDIPFIIVSGAISEETAVKMMKAGAHDYLNKDQLARLAPAIRREIGDAIGRRERRETMKALQESERRHRTLVESMNDTVFVVNNDLTISEYYSSKNGSFDKEKVTTPGTKLNEIFPTGFVKRYSKYLTSVKDTHEPRTIEFSLDRGGEKTWFSANMSPHEDNQRVVIVLRDVSSLKQAQEELVATGKIAMLYLDLMGHDIRNHLQAIMISSNLLGSHVTDATSLRLLYEISSCVEECDELISTVQATKDLLRTPMEKISLNTAVAICVKNLTEIYRNAVISTKIPKKNTYVLADRFINLLLSNIIDNAVRHNHKEKAQVWVSLKPHDDGYAINVADDGPGIDNEMKEALFDPDSRVGGVGIHQSIQIAEKYGGVITVGDRVENQWQKGAEIIIWLPKYKEEIPKGGILLE